MSESSPPSATQKRRSISFSKETIIGIIAILILGIAVTLSLKEGKWAIGPQESPWDLVEGTITSAKITEHETASDSGDPRKFYRIQMEISYPYLDRQYRSTSLLELEKWAFPNAESELITGKKLQLRVNPANPEVISIGEPYRQ